MYAFKSWLVANIEVILIVFTILLIALSGLVLIPKSSESFKALFFAIAFFSAVICAVIVGCVRNGVASLLAIAILVGIAVFGSKKGSADNQNTEIEVAEQQVKSPEQEAFNNTMDEVIENINWSGLIWLSIIACVFGVCIAVYANRNFDDVVSRRFLYRNSTVSVFEEQWKYTFNRFYAGFMTFSAIALDILILSACLKVA